MTKRKPKEHVQQAIAEESVSSLERRKLRRQISTMKRLPNNFRDIVAGTHDWEAFATITGRRKEMDAWDNGPIMYFGKLNEHEEMIFGSQNRLVGIAKHKELNKESWVDVLTVAVSFEASWIYLPDEEPEVIRAFNVLLSRFGFNVRAKGRLMSEHSGKPVGVVR